MPSLSVNFLAVLIAAASNMVLGFLWYGPLFGKYWMAQIGKSREELPQNMGPIFLSVVASIVTALVLAIFLGLVPGLDVVKGIVWGILAAVGFIATSTITNGAYEGRKGSVSGLFVAYQIIALAVMGAIIGAMA